MSVTCAATDTASVSVTSNCAAPLAAGPAYSFAPGPHVVNATATDAAGLTTLASATFTVDANYDDLCELTERFSSKRHENDLYEKLKQARKAETKGKLHEKREKIAEYVKKVNEESSKRRENTFTSSEAAILIGFAKSL